MLQELVLLGQESSTRELTIQPLLRSDTLIPVVAIVGGLTVTLVWVFMHYFYSWLELCKNTEVKLRMVEAGHSADEIERVIWAGKSEEDEMGESMTSKRPRRNTPHVPPAKPIPQHVA